MRLSSNVGGEEAQPATAAEALSSVAHPAVDLRRYLAAS